MSLRFQITIRASGHTLSQGVQLAARAGIQIVDSRNHCKIYTSKIDDREYRLIGALGFPSNEKPKLWQRIDGDDLSAVVAIPEAVTFTRGLEDTVHYTNNATS